MKSREEVVGAIGGNSAITHLKKPDQQEELS